MYTRETQLSYRRTALSGASSIGLVIALYDTLSGNLRRAAAAMRERDIEKRCAELNHALLVIGQLESMIDPKSGAELAGNLSLFYAYLRSKIMEGSVQQSAPLLETQIELILQVRAAWQQRDSAATTPPGANGFGAEFLQGGFSDRVAFSQSV